MSYLLDPKQIKEILEGMLSEQAMREYINKELKYRYFSPDLIMLYKNDYIIIECKFQEAYNNFKGNSNRYGHGLPKEQFNNYCDIFNKKKIDTVLFVFCRTFKKLYYRRISKLNELEDRYFEYSKTFKRIIFDINKFHISKNVNEVLFDKLKDQLERSKNRWEDILNIEDEF